MCFLPEIDFPGIALDSRLIKPGWLYVALPGQSTHGAKYISQALSLGASAVLTDEIGAQIIGEVDVPVVVSDSLRAQMAEQAAKIWGYPASSLSLFAVTGTTGKTSTVSLLAAGLRAAGVKAATMGTLGVRIGQQTLRLGTTTVTTPESPDIQRSLARLLALDVRAVGMEVSSHALAMHRVDSLSFDVAAFTNLGSDHLDYHHTQEDYFEAKAQLFQASRCQRAVVNVDDLYGRRLFERVATAGEIPAFSVSARQPADYQVIGQVERFNKSVIDIKTPNGIHHFDLGMPGEFSVRNALLAAALIDQSEYDLVAALNGFAAAEVPGRMQRVDLGQNAPHVVVDFAHSPEAIGACLASLPGRRIVVFGGGGDRDRLKRAPMGAAAAANADVVIVTDDNPRSENPQTIRDEILVGAFQEAKYSGAQIIDGGDRRSAIALALKSAQPTDWVAILGKGHETEQIWADSTVPFADADVAHEEWRKFLEGLNG